MHNALYSQIAWRRLRKRVLERDSEVCTYARFFGSGGCAGILHVHHLRPVSDGGPELPDLDGCITLCAAHHPLIEKLRRVLLNSSPETCSWRHCPHHHRTAQSRIQCELRLNGSAAA